MSWTWETTGTHNSCYQKKALLQVELLRATSATHPFWARWQPSWSMAPTQPVCSFLCWASLQQHRGQGAWGLPPPISVPRAASAQGIAGCGQPPPCLALPRQWKLAEMEQGIWNFYSLESPGLTSTSKPLKNPALTCCCLSLSDTHAHQQKEEANHLHKQEFSYISKPGFEHTSGKLEQPEKKKEKKKTTKTLCFATRTSSVSVMNILRLGQSASSALVQWRPIPQAIDLLMPLCS